MPANAERIFSFEFFPPATAEAPLAARARNCRRWTEVFFRDVRRRRFHP
jgi:hypothetical protein